MNPYGAGNPFDPGTQTGDLTRMRGKNRRPIWLTLVLVVVFLALFWLILGRGGQDGETVEPDSLGSDAESP